jgi:hypothetical protein
MRTLQLQQRIFSTFICRSTAIQQKNWTAISTIHSPAGRFKSLINEFPCFQSKRLSSSFPHNENACFIFQFKINQYLHISRKMGQTENSLMAIILSVKSQEVKIPSNSKNIFHIFLDRIAHKWSKASGPGGSNVNAS